MSKPKSKPILVEVEADEFKIVDRVRRVPMPLHKYWEQVRYRGRRYQLHKMNSGEQGIFLDSPLQEA